MHDGSIATLVEVVEFYNRGGGKNSNLDPIMTPLGLTPEEIQSLVAFLKALSEAVE
jgi:cytochrome c peroxidase